MFTYFLEFVSAIHPLSLTVTHPKLQQQQQHHHQQRYKQQHQQQPQHFFTAFFFKGLRRQAGTISKDHFLKKFTAFENARKRRTQFD